MYNVIKYWSADVLGYAQLYIYFNIVLLFLSTFPNINIFNTYEMGFMYLPLN